MKKIILILSLIVNALSFSQVQIGSDIDPLTASGDFGESVAMSSDGNIIATNGENIDIQKNFVRVFQNISNVWTQVGSDINDIGDFDIFGRDLSMSADGSRIAIGIPTRDNNGLNSGIVQVYENIGGVWTQIGSDILGESFNDSLGASVSMSSDGNLLAIGIPELVSDKSGRVEIYAYQNENWTQIGSDIMGDNGGDKFGKQVSLSSDGLTVGIGAHEHSESESNLDTGQVKVYRNTGGTWTQIGATIVGLENDFIGESISLSSNGDIVAFGAPKSYDLRGCARVYENINGVWNQIGSDILGENPSDFCGYTIDLSSDGGILALGTPFNDDNGTLSGHTRIFKNIEGVWTQMGMDIDGEAVFDLSAEFNNVRLSSDGQTVAIGARQNNGGGLGDDSGHVRVFDLSMVLSIDDQVLEETRIYPNPTNNELIVRLNENTEFEKLQVYNSLGQKILESNKIVVDIQTLAKGQYFVIITANNVREIKKLIVN